MDCGWYFMKQVLLYENLGCLWYHDNNNNYGCNVMWFDGIIFIHFFYSRLVVDDEDGVCCRCKLKRQSFLVFRFEKDMVLMFYMQSYKNVIFKRRKCISFEFGGDGDCSLLLIILSFDEEGVRMELMITDVMNFQTFSSGVNRKNDELSDVILCTSSIWYFMFDHYQVCSTLI